ncbi:MAG: 2-oxoglutarate dehydrogenase complex dihydrolipoyllysine-residue succinyltransferase [Oligoflexia bacterium]|jgi:2-oxoglutarate dehydrogenase E2 component (dihydrolipoamide succinyltransferase)
MKHSIKAPSVGESITEVSILKWRKQAGQAVKNGEVILEIESDKATVEVAAEATGALIITKQAGERIPVGAVIGEIDDSVAGSVAPETPVKVAEKAQPASATTQAVNSNGKRPSGPSPSGPALTAQLAGPGTAPIRGHTAPATPAAPVAHAAPAARPTPAAPQYVDQPGDRRVPLSMLRLRIAERLKSAQNTAAILSTFNEVDMKPVMDLRNQHKETFKSKHGVALSFMSFFTRACIEALKLIPEVNASMDGKDIVYHDYIDMGIAVGTDRGLVVPVIRGADQMDFVAIEKKMTELAAKARDGKLTIADLTGGTFTISNGGTYGSLLSTPILNPPQSGILGMHKIQERPVAINGKVEIRPMMYLTLSYDHRIIDGKGAVTFLVTVRDFLENPEKLKFTY